MVGAITGFFGSIVGLIASAIAAAVGLTFFIVLWKSGALPEVVGWGTALIGGAFSFLTGILGFLRDLLTFAGS